VSLEAPAINTEDQTISQTIDNQAVIELPRDSRNVYTFLYLDPNVTQSAADGSFKFIGAQSYGASFSLDGQRSNGGISLIIRCFPQMPISAGVGVRLRGWYRPGTSLTNQTGASLTLHELWRLRVKRAHAMENERCYGRKTSICL